MKGFRPHLRLGALVLATPFILGGAPALAQDGPPGVGTHFITTQTPLTNDKGVFESIFTHRFVTAVKDAGGGLLLGLDSGATIGLGIDYTFVKNLAFQLYRSQSYADYEFALKFTALRPTQSLPIAIGVRGGASWLTAPYIAEKEVIAFGQLHISGTIANFVTIAVSPSYSERTLFFDESQFNVPINIQIRLTKSIAAMGELIPKRNRSEKSVPQWSFGIEKSVYHHKFALIIGNTWVSTVNQMIGGDFRARDVPDSNIRLGFNVARSFDIATD